MRFTINKDQFLKGLMTAGHAIGNKAPNPVLLCFKLELTSRGLEITGSDSDITVWTLIPNTLNEKEIIRNGSQGAALVNAHVLTEVVRKFEGAELSFEIIDNAIAKLDDGKSTFKLNSIVAEEYPEINLERTGNAFSLSAADLTTLVSQTAFAALDKDTRPILMAINLRADGGKLTATATDSARLSRKSIAIDPSLHFSANVPAKTLSQVVSLLEGADEVEMSATAEKVVFSFGTTLVSSSLIAGDYPAVSSSIIPNNFNYYLDVNAQQLLNAVDRVSVLVTDRASVVKLSMADDQVEVSSSSDQTGSGVEKLTTIQYTGERLEIAFNAAFVSQAVRALGSEDVRLSFVGEMKPFVIRNPKDDSVVELITPMRTR
jgi:DNA polymerase-3 subunit beta